ncbi:hypothetical protein D3C81_2055310 [compost metagenome]
MNSAVIRAQPSNEPLIRAAPRAPRTAISQIPLTSTSSPSSSPGLSLSPSRTTDNPATSSGELPRASG